MRRALSRSPQERFQEHSSLLQPETMGDCSGNLHREAKGLRHAVIPAAIRGRAVWTMKGAVDFHGAAQHSHGAAEACSAAPSSWKEVQSGLLDVNENGLLAPGIANGQLHSVVVAGVPGETRPLKELFQVEVADILSFLGS